MRYLLAILAFALVLGCGAFIAAAFGFHWATEDYGTTMLLSVIVASIIGSYVLSEAWKS